MKFKTKFFIIVLLFLAVVLGICHFSKQSSIFSFEFSTKQNNNDPELEKIVQENIAGTKGHFAVYIEELEATRSASSGQADSAKRTPDESKPTLGEVLRGAPLHKYVLNENESFPSASLYKLVLITSVLKEVEAGLFKLDDTISGSKSNLIRKYGGLDFGYEDMPENFTFTIEEALERIGRISDNFAAIMLTERLRSNGADGSNGSNDPLLLMARELGMQNTDFMAEQVTTTASDIGTFFKALYNDQIISPQASAEIKGILKLNQINDRIPALLPEGVVVIHKTGELPYLRHDAGIVYLSGKSQESRVKKDYIIVLLSKDLQFEDEGMDTLAKISKDVYNYFSGLAGN